MTAPRTIAVITTSRADYYIYRPLLRRICAEPTLHLQLLVTGAHLLRGFGHTVDKIIADGFPIAERIEVPLSADTPAAAAEAMGATTARCAAVFQRCRPDILVVLGDRFEMCAAAMAAVPFNIAIAHIAGGAVTAGAIDEVFRHAITKMAHLHFVETQLYAERIIRMGEHPRCVHVVGALALDEIMQRPPPDRRQLEQRYGGPWHKPPLLVTFHPVTRQYDQTAWQITELLTALAQFDHPVVFTYPNADPGGLTIREKIEAFVASRKNAVIVPNLGNDYAGMLAVAAAMVGNSSSGLVEAPAFKLPVVNVGLRQRGRLAPKNILHASSGTREEISAMLQRALSEDFRRTLDNLVNPYGDGHAAEKITNVLVHQPISSALLGKEFYDGPAPAGNG